MKRILEAIKVLRQKISFAELRRILNTPLQRAIHLGLPTFYGWTCNISILKNHGGSIDHAIPTGFFEKNPQELQTVIKITTCSFMDKFLLLCVFTFE